MSMGTKKNKLKGGAAIDPMKFFSTLGPTGANVRDFLNAPGANVGPTGATLPIVTIGPTETNANVTAGPTGATETNANLTAVPTGPTGATETHVTAGPSSSETGPTRTNVEEPSNSETASLSDNLGTNVVAETKMYLEKLKALHQPIFDGLKNTGLSDLIIQMVEEWEEKIKDKVEDKDKKKIDTMIAKIESALDLELKRNAKVETRPEVSNDALAKTILDTLKTKEYVDPSNRYIVKKNGQMFSIEPKPKD